MGFQIMPTLWITYAWSDNKDQSFDYLVQQLSRAGLDVKIDRTELVAGKRLWEQIDQNISWGEIDAWAIYCTRKSLESEPCQEELAYALDRCLRESEEHFPLIGIFPEQVERKLVPSLIATRLYVSLDDPDAIERIVSGVTGEARKISEKEIGPIAYDLSNPGVLEFWPRIGNLSRPFALVPVSEFKNSGGGTPYSENLNLQAGGRGAGGQGIISSVSYIQSDDGEWNGTLIGDGIGSGRSGFVYLPDNVCSVIVGGHDNSGQQVFSLIEL